MLSRLSFNTRLFVIMATIALIVVLAVGAGFAGFEYWWRGTPPYSVSQIGRAIETHDLQLFRRRVDVRSVVNRMMDDMMKEEKQSESSALGQSLVELLRPRIVEAFEAQVERFVESGQFQEDKTNTNLSLKELNARNVVGPIVYTRIDGKVAIVGLTVTPQDTKKPMVVDLKMRQTPDGYWQLMEIDFAKLLRQSKANKTAASH